LSFKYKFFLCLFSLLIINIIYININIYINTTIKIKLRFRLLGLYLIYWLLRFLNTLTFILLIIIINFTFFYRFITLPSLSVIFKLLKIIILHFFSKIIMSCRTLASFILIILILITISFYFIFRIFHINLLILVLFDKIYW